MNYLEQEQGGSVPFLGMGPFSWNSNIHDGAERYMTDRCKPPFSDYADRPFDTATFYSYFPEFENSAAYPETFVAAAAKQAARFVRPSWCRELDGSDREYAFMLTVAHMAVLQRQQQAALAAPGAGGGGAGGLGADASPGVVSSASVGGVSISKGQMVSPKDFWEEWYYRTPYGRTLLGFLTQCAAPGLIYMGEENIADYLRE